jgi:hypothetical protein
MFPIYEVSAAPHFPQPLKPFTVTAESETLASQNPSDIEIAAYDGEIFVALTAS